MSLRSIVALALFALTTAATGCSYVEELNVPLITPTGKQVDAPRPREERMYPEELPIGEPLDIQVTRIGNGIQLDIRTTRRYDEAELWLTRQYGAQIGEVPVGRSPLISLGSFANHYGEVYPVGGFLSPDADRSLVLADLVVDGEIHKIVVRLNPDWQQR